jgi:hypothetical protein
MSYSAITSFLNTFSIKTVYTVYLFSSFVFVVVYFLILYLLLLRIDCFLTFQKGYREHFRNNEANCRMQNDIFRTNFCPAPKNCFRSFIAIFRWELGVEMFCSTAVWESKLDKCFERTTIRTDVKNKYIILTH